MPTSKIQQLLNLLCPADALSDGTSCGCESTPQKGIAHCRDASATGGLGPIMLAGSEHPLFQNGTEPPLIINGGEITCEYASPQGSQKGAKMSVARHSSGHIRQSSAPYAKMYVQKARGIGQGTLERPATSPEITDFLGNQDLFTFQPAGEANGVVVQPDNLLSLQSTPG